MARRRVIGIGNTLRGDDGAGRRVARRLAAAAPPGVEVMELDGGAAELLAAWENAGDGEVVVVDAARSGAPPGTVHRFEASHAALPATLDATSSHGLGLAAAVELARALGRLPRRLSVYAIESAGFTAGDELSPSVAAAVEEVVRELATGGG
jgi:hydrogenase maturation protease